MPIRIYALAKDLKIDSKELVEYCNRAGIKGIGSALASIEDDQILTLKAWMQSKATRRMPSGPTPQSDLKAVLSTPVISAKSVAPPPPSPPKRSFPIRAGITTGDRSIEHSERELFRSSPRVPLSLAGALSIDASHVQVAELSSILESLLVAVLDVDGSNIEESKLASLIDLASETCFRSVGADAIHKARIARNDIVHRRTEKVFPSEESLRHSRNSLVLAILDLLDYAGPELKAEILSDSKQFFPRSKQKKETPEQANPGNGAAIRKPK